MSTPFLLSSTLGYPADRLRSMVSSLRKVYRGPAAMLVDSETGPDLNRFLERNDIEPLAFDTARWISGPRCAARLIRQGEILFERRKRHDRVMLVDAADTLFLADPFADWPEEAGIVFCRGNRAPEIIPLVAEVYGPRIAETVAARPGLAPGVLFGSMAGVRAYLETAVIHAMPSRMARLAPDAPLAAAIGEVMEVFTPLLDKHTVDNGRVVLSIAPHGTEDLPDPSGAAVLLGGHQWPEARDRLIRPVLQE